MAPAKKALHARVMFTWQLTLSIISIRINMGRFFSQTQSGAIQQPRCYYHIWTLRYNNISSAYDMQLNIWMRRINTDTICDPRCLLITLFATVRRSLKIAKFFRPQQHECQWYQFSCSLAYHLPLSFLRHAQQKQTTQSTRNESHMTILLGGRW